MLKNFFIGFIKTKAIKKLMGKNYLEQKVSGIEKFAVSLKIYFRKRELFTPDCSHFFIIGLSNDIGRAVTTPNETRRIKSVVK
tara:strand:- start:31 stop:279 length:249 start_codon:yes stop_codon:yes gene_type:complete